MVGYTYKITNKVNGKSYIGKTTKTVQERWKEHLKEVGKERCANRPLYRSIKKYGASSFIVETLEEVPLEHLSKREIYWIEHFHTYGNGYNATLGGDGKILYDYDYIARLLIEGRKYQEIADMVGCCLDTVAFVNKKYQIGHVPRNNYKERSIPVEQYDLEGNYIQSFPSYAEAARWLFENGRVPHLKGGIKSHIGLVVKGKQKTAYGFIWKRVL